LRRLWPQLMIAAILAVPMLATAAGKAGYIATPDACYVPEKVNGEVVRLKKAGVCEGKPGRVFVGTDRETVQVFVDGKFWKEVRVEEMGVPDISSNLARADRMAGELTIPPNSARVEMEKTAGKLDSYYRSPEFQGRLKSESERVKAELFGESLGKFYPDSLAEERKGKLFETEKIYVFVSSSMPLQTMRNYAASIARLHDPRITLVMRGFVGGMAKIRPTIDFVGSVLKEDPDCDPSGSDCRMQPASLIVDPLLFRRYGIEKVPAVVYAQGVKVEDPGLSEGDARNAKLTESFTLYGDASLEYILELIGRETGSPSLKGLVSALPAARQ